MAQFTPEQSQLLDEMLDLFSLQDLMDMQAKAGPETILAHTAKLAEGGCYDAQGLLAQWAFWERYEAGLADGRHDRAEAVAMMVYSASDAILLEGRA